MFLKQTIINVILVDNYRITTVFHCVETKIKKMFLSFQNVVESPSSGHFFNAIISFEFFLDNGDRSDFRRRLQYKNQIDAIYHRFREKFQN